MPFSKWGRRCLLILLPAVGDPVLGEGTVDVAITGVSDSVARNIRAHLNLERLECTVSELHLRNVLSSADDQIFQALRALGYYQAQWDITRRLDTSSRGKCWNMTIAVTPGPPTTIRHLRLELAGEGVDDPELQQRLSRLPLAEGDRVHHGRYEEAKKILRQAAVARGYFDYSFTESRLAVDRDANQASIDLVFDTGRRYRFGAISVTESPLDKEFISDYVRFETGDPFDARQLIRLQSNLINSQYFEHVNVEQSEPDTETGAVDLHIDFAVKSKYESTFGVGYSTDLGPRVNYQLQNRRFNSDGDTYQLTTQFSPVESQVGFQFQQPGSDPVNEKTVWALGWQTQDNDTYTSRGYNAEVSRIKLLSNEWVRTTSLSLLWEDFDIASESDNVLFLYPGVNFQKTRSNDTRYPTRGWRLSAGVRGGADDLLSATTFVQARLGGKAIVPLLGGRLIGRSSLGATYVEDFSKMPASLRFFAGGDNSVRGFDYESLGPTDDEGEVLGGEHLLTASIEYDYRVYSDYSLAVFYDTGNAFNTDDFTVHNSVGLGVRWHSPIGPIRLDFAFPLNEGGFQFHISMGPDL